MPTDPEPLTLYGAVARGVAALDPDGNDTGLGELLERFEDADEPIGDPEAASERIYEELGALDPEAEDGTLQVAAAIAVYLCFRRDEADQPPERLIELAVAAEFSDGVPESVRAVIG
jgi:hypothetical protein